MRKYIFSIFLFTLIFSVLSVNAQQKLKLGHINSQELLASMPESDSAQKKLERIANEHQQVLEEMTVEFNKKFDTYRKAISAGTMSDLARNAKEAELEDLQNRIQQFEQTAQDDLQQKRVELFTPIQERALKAVNEVAEENGFTYIFDMGMGAVVYSSPDSQDIMPLVKTKLGIK
jgi:outer membrane protein